VPAHRQFDISTHREPGGILRLSLAGELDLSNVDRLTACLEQVRPESDWVQLDLSKLQFMDSTGIGALVTIVQEARREGRRVEVSDQLAPQVERIFELSGIASLIWPAPGE
jgi:anti-anti-sigma factor